MSRNIFLPAPEVRIFSATSSPLTMEDACLVSFAWCRAVGCVVPYQRVLLGCDNAGRFLKRSKRGGCTVSTMVLSEARGPSAFSGCPRGHRVYTEAGCARHRGAYRRLAYSPSNPSVSRTDQPPSEKNKGRWKGSSPETLKRLAVLVFPRRNLLPSSTESA